MYRSAIALFCDPSILTDMHGNLSISFRQIQICWTTWQKPWRRWTEKKWCPFLGLEMYLDFGLPKVILPSMQKDQLGTGTFDLWHSPLQSQSQRENQSKKKPRTTKPKQKTHSKKAKQKQTKNRHPQEKQKQNKMGSYHQSITTKAATVGLHSFWQLSCVHKPGEGAEQALGASCRLMMVHLTVM